MDEYLSNILIVDDNPENLKVVSGFLKEAGYKIALALNGLNALEILHDNKIDLILLDVMMPEIDGFEVCQMIKQQKDLHDIPVIFLTALTDTESLLKGFHVGGVDYVAKPFIREELLIRVKNHLDLSFARKKLVDTIKTRDKLYSIIAHDIRAPFSNISILISALSEGIIKADSDKFKEILTNLDKSAHETATLLTNLLDWTKLQVGTLALKPQTLNINPVINDCINLHEGNAHHKNITIEFHSATDRLEAFFDEVTMHTVFRNIISNAIKFTPQNGIISIDAKRTDNHYVTVIFHDNGAGIPKEILNKIMVDNETYTSRGTNNEKGSGLGIHLIRDLLEQNKSSFSIESEEHKGTTVTIKIPRNA
jgi:two-component system sensor histidine kinase/response regulator